MTALRNIFGTRARFGSRAGRWAGCTPLSPAERMAQYSERHAAEMNERAALGAAAPRVRLVDGRPTLVALPGRVNALPKAKDTQPEEKL